MPPCRNSWPTCNPYYVHRAGRRKETKRALIARQEEYAGYVRLVQGMQKNSVEPSKCELEAMAEKGRMVDALNRQQEQQEANLREVEATQSYATRLATVLNSPAKSLAALAPAEKSELLRLYLRKIVLNGDSLILERQRGGPVIGILQRDGEGKDPWRKLSVKWLE